MTDFLLLLVALAPTDDGPTVMVANTVASGVAAIHVQAATRQVRDAANRSDDLVVVLPERACQGRRCLDQARGRADFLLWAALRAQRGMLEARVELVDVRSEEAVGVSLNRAPSTFGTATLDLPLLVVEVLAQLTAPSRPPPETEEVEEDDELEEAEKEEVEEEPQVVTTAAPAVAAPAPAKPRSSLTPPASEPVPHAGKWIGSCVAYPEYGEVYLEPDDWERYRSYRKSTRNPLPVHRWIVKQNEESWALNFMWITPPVLTVGGLLSDSESVATIGAVMLPVAVISAIVDAADVGEVDPCLRGPPKSSRRSW